MIYWKERFEKYNLKEVLQTIYENRKLIQLNDKINTSDLNSVFSICDDIATQIENIYIAKTSISTIEKISEGLLIIKNQIDYLISDQDRFDYELFMNAANLLLEAIPFIYDRRINTYQNNIKDANQRLNVLFDDFKSGVNKFGEESKTIVDKIKSLEIETETLASLAASKVQTDDFKNRSESELAKANKWTYATWGFALSSLIILVLAFLYEIYGFYNHNFQMNQVNYQLLGTKFFLIATLGLIAKWSSKRAQKHLAEESKYHRLFINMKTIDPFIASFSIDKKVELKSQIALKFFTEIEESNASTEYDNSTFVDLIKNITLPTKEK